MRPNLLIILASALAFTAGCDSPAKPTGSATATTGDGTDGETTSGGTSAAPGETTGVAPTTGMPVGYCHGFQLAAEAPYLSLYVLGGEELADGVHWPLECAPMGGWMFGLYPSLGGWDPMTNEVTLKVEVDVAGHNIGPAEQFFSAEVKYYIGCGEAHAAALGVMPVVPPLAAADLAQLDGLPAKVRVTVLADGKELMVEAMVTLSAPGDVLLMGCR